MAMRSEALGTAAVVGAAPLAASMALSRLAAKAAMEAGLVGSMRPPGGGALYTPPPTGMGMGGG